MHPVAGRCKHCRTSLISAPTPTAVSSALTPRTAASQSAGNTAIAPQAAQDGAYARGQAPAWWRRWTVWLVIFAALAIAVAIVGLAWPHMLGLGPKRAAQPHRPLSRAAPTPVPPATDLPQGDPWAPTPTPPANGADASAPAPDTHAAPDTTHSQDSLDLFDPDANALAPNRAPAQAVPPAASHGFAKRVCERIATCSGNASLMTVCEWAQHYESLRDDALRSISPVAARCLDAISEVDCQLRPALVIGQLLQRGCLEWLMEEP